MSVFELDWLGGTAERLHHQHAGTRVADIPWGRVTTGLDAAELDRRRTVWTLSAYQEWCAAGAFSALVTAMIDARAPVDLIGMSGRFVADEMVHTELCARMAAAYGGGAPLETDPAGATPVTSPDADAMQRLCELAIRVSCVGESVSLPLLGHSRNHAPDELTRAVLDCIVRDEGPHASVGWLVLDWALPRVDACERERLAAVAEDAIDALRPALVAVSDDIPRHQAVLTRQVMAPLARRGVNIDSSAVQLVAG